MARSRGVKFLRVCRILRNDSLFGRGRGLGCGKFTSFRLGLGFESMEGGKSLLGGIGDGLGEFHDKFRGSPNSFKKAMESYEALGGTVVETASYPELSTDELAAYDFTAKLDVLLSSQPDLLFLVSYTLDGAAITWELDSYFSTSYQPQLLGRPAIGRGGP